MKLRGFTLSTLAATALLSCAGAAFAAKTLVYCSEGSPEGFNPQYYTTGTTAEASSVPPSWHGWLHHTVDVPPTEERYQPRPWQKPHRPNLTGTPGAHRPTGSTLAQGRRPKATGDYKAWNPGR